MEFQLEIFINYLPDKLFVIKRKKVIFKYAVNNLFDEIPHFYDECVKSVVRYL